MNVHNLLTNAINGVTCAHEGCELTPEEEYCPLHEQEAAMGAYDSLFDGDEYQREMMVDQAVGKE
jgi:hypothetical protein